MNLNTDYAKKEVGKYKYILLKPIVAQTMCTGHLVIHEYFTLLPNGILTVKADYMSDGASSKLASTNDKTIRAVFVHDCLFQILQDMLLFESDKFDEQTHILVRKQANITMLNLLLEDDYNTLVSFAWYLAVHYLGDSHAEPQGTSWTQ